MADFYPPGNVRLFYRSVGSKVDVIPTAGITGPDFSVIPGIELRPLGGGVFCFEWNFVKDGSYLVTFYENGFVTTIHHLEIHREKKQANGDKLINP